MSAKKEVKKAVRADSATFDHKGADAGAVALEDRFQKRLARHKELQTKYATKSVLVDSSKGNLDLTVGVLKALLFGTLLGVLALEWHTYRWNVACLVALLVLHVAKCIFVLSQKIVKITDTFISILFPLLAGVSFEYAGQFAPTSSLAGMRAPSQYVITGLIVVLSLVESFMKGSSKSTSRKGPKNPFPTEPISRVLSVACFAMLSCGAYPSSGIVTLLSMNALLAMVCFSFGILVDVGYLVVYASILVTEHALHLHTSAQYVATPVFT